MDIESFLREHGQELPTDIRAKLEEFVLQSSVENAEPGTVKASYFVEDGLVDFAITLPSSIQLDFRTILRALKSWGRRRGPTRTDIRNVLNDKNARDAAFEDYIQGSFAT